MRVYHNCFFSRREQEEEGIAVFHFTLGVVAEIQDVLKQRHSSAYLRSV